MLPSEHIMEQLAAECMSNFTDPNIKTVSSTFHRSVSARYGIFKLFLSTRGQTITFRLCKKEKGMVMTTISRVTYYKETGDTMQKNDIFYDFFVAKIKQIVLLYTFEIFDDVPHFISNGSRALHTYVVGTPNHGKVIRGGKSIQVDLWYQTPMSDEEIIEDCLKKCTAHVKTLNTDHVINHHQRSKFDEAVIRPKSDIVKAILGLAPYNTIKELV